MSRYEYPNMYYAYNETFVDDEGLPCFRRDSQQQQQHETDYKRKHDERQTEFFIDDDEEEEYFDQVDTRYYDDKLDYLNLSVRHSPIGEGARYTRNSESSSPTAISQNHQQPPPRPPSSRHRSSSVPGRRGKVPNVLAPMVAQAERQQTLRRSHSTIIQSNRDRVRIANAAPPEQHVREPRRQFQQFQIASQTPRIQRKMSTPTRLKSYSHLIPPSAETSLIQMPPTQPRTTAVISPNYRTRDAQCALPLLAGSPTKLRLVSNSPSKSNSWSDLSNRRLPSEPLWFAGIILLLTGGISCILCLYILSKSGRKYYLDSGAISGFVCMILGLVGCRTARWLPHRHYVTGYILLSAFSLLECGILAVLASDSNQLANNIIEIAGGAICGLSGLCILLATFGFLTSACCNLLPPDSRIGHSVPGFSI